MNLQKGDIVLVPFPFTDLSSTKKRPALVLISDPRDVTLAFITTETKKWDNKENITLSPTNDNGLKKDSLIRLAKITTLEKQLIIGRLGRLSNESLQEVNRNLISLFDL